MLKPSFTTRFRRDLKRMLKRGKDEEKFKEVAQLLIQEVDLPPRYRDHMLHGGFGGRRECHIEPDWLLIYLIREGGIIFERTGSHSDLFV